MSGHPWDSLLDRISGAFSSQLDKVPVSVVSRFSVFPSHVHWGQSGHLKSHYTQIHSVSAMDHLSACLFVCLSAGQTVCMLAYLPSCLSVHLYFCSCVCESIYLFTYLSADSVRRIQPRKEGKQFLLLPPSAPYLSSCTLAPCLPFFLSLPLC